MYLKTKYIISPFSTCQAFYQTEEISIFQHPTDTGLKKYDHTIKVDLSESYLNMYRLFCNKKNFF